MNKRFTLNALLTLSAILFFTACGKKFDKETLERIHQEQIAQIQEAHPQATRTPKDCFYTITETGEGDKPQKGQQIQAHYIGTLFDGTEFDSSYKRGAPFSVKAGVGDVIPAWDEALLDMQAGEKRTLYVPSKLGYGASGAGRGVIPANAILIFQIELTYIQR